MICSAFAQGDSPERAGPGSYSLSLKVGGIERRALVRVPLFREGRPPTSLVIMLHGGGGTPEIARDSTGWADKADEVGFFVTFPEATRRDPSQPPSFLRNPPLWNDGSGRGHAGEQNVDDIGFLNALIDVLTERLGVNRGRIYVTGFSNGASMAFRAGAELSRRVRAIAPVSGHHWLKRTKPERPGSMIYLIGSSDPLNPLEGGQVRTPWGETVNSPPIQESILAWAMALGCPLEPKTLQEKDGIRSISYGPGRDDSEVLFYVIEGLGHVWPGGNPVLSEKIAGKGSDKVRAVDLIWNFFTGHSRE